MLNNLKKMINAEAESDLEVDLMMEAVNNSIADMFIKDDGEIDMAEKDIEDILEKIPGYDVEAEMNKKLDKIVEFYIPDELKLESVEESLDEYDEYLEEGLFGKYRKMSNEDLRAKIDELRANENEVEAGKYQKELDRRLRKDSKKEAREEEKAAKKEAKAAKKAAKHGDVPVAESWEEYLESFEYEAYLEEGLFGKHRKMTDADLKAKIDELELEGKESEARKYKKELERRMKKEEKKKAKEGVKVPGTEPANKVAESWEEYLESLSNNEEDEYENYLESLNTIDEHEDYLAEGLFNKKN